VTARLALAFRAIACDRSIDDGLRLEAAEQLPDLDRRAAAEAFRVIACDASVDDGLRSSAAEPRATGPFHHLPPAT
jgi:hypothetical protein